MRLIPLVATTLVLSLCGSAFAQPPSPQATASLAVAERGGGEWVEFASREDRFTCNFQTQPKVTETTWTSEYGYTLPARVYRADGGLGTYSMTVVDYRNLEQLGLERVKSCPAGAEPCKGSPTTGVGYSKNDVRGAIAYASWKFMQRDAKVTHFMWNFIDLVEGHQIQLTNNKDKSRTFASIYMHENKLYVMEATVPANYPEPGLFQQSLGWLDENGVGLRYQSVYSNGFPAPPRVIRGGQGQGQGRIDAPGASPAQGGQGR